MDMTSEHDSENMLLPDTLREYPIWDPPKPELILADHDNGTYLVSWESTSAGIIHRDPGLFTKDELLKKHPCIVKAWETMQRAEKAEARQIEQTFANFIGRFLDTNDDNNCDAAPQRDVECQQTLRPGMRQHWGELRKCETHPCDRPSEFVCKGCRVAHYAQECHAFDRDVIMARGARVPVCKECETMATDFGQLRRCGCDTRWTCFQCRERVLKKLAKAREKYVERRCGYCARICGEGRSVEFCLHCAGWRVYADVVETVQAVESVEATE